LHLREHFLLTGSEKEKNFKDQRISTRLEKHKVANKRKLEISSSHTLKTRFLEFPHGLASLHHLIEPNLANGPPNTITFV